jgi:hypothetical protein
MALLISTCMHRRNPAIRTFQSMCSLWSITVFGCALRLSGCAIKRTERLSSYPVPPVVVATNSHPEFKQSDEAFLNAVQRRWYDSLNGLPSTNIPSCKVVVCFLVQSSGMITNLVVTENTCNELFALMCETAIRRSPYPLWSEQMRNTEYHDYRPTTITFYHHGQRPKRKNADTQVDYQCVIENRIEKAERHPEGMEEISRGLSASDYPRTETP